MTKPIFITATDTESGKTKIASALLEKLSKYGKTIGFKPIAAGCETDEVGLINEDALILQQSASVPLTYSTVNPIALEPAIAPHIAAQLANVALNKEVLQKAYQDILKTEADYLIIEGAGGWKLPLNENEFMSDWVADNKLPVILVVGMKLGCLNHALLSLDSIKQSGVTLLGWVANCIEGEMPYLAENITTLESYIAKHFDAPKLGTVPRLTQGQSAQEYLSIDCIL
ncbi:dethiobiotin synthase [Catenovulum sediminis]|uniref:dethiobiotin synthase n=1 Tax=Catenovulum sediminis TaxID=1740262 RepID=UPI001181486E|nr:dethiobiotin synthase [Catenovulum sediminis]